MGKHSSSGNTRDPTAYKGLLRSLKENLVHGKKGWQEKVISILNRSRKVLLMGPSTGISSLRDYILEERGKKIHTMSPRPTYPESSLSN